MTVFWIMASLMILVALAMVLPALMTSAESNDHDRHNINLTLFDQRLANLDEQRRSAEIDAAGYRSARQEIEAQMLSDLENGEHTPTPTSATPALAIATAAIIPIAALGLYFHFGSPELLNTQPKHTTAKSAPSNLNVQDANRGELPHSVEEMVAGLEERLRREPNNPDGWLMLGRSFAAMNQLTKARDALLEANRQRPDHPTTLVAYAEVVAGMNGNRLDGEAHELVHRALSIDPHFSRALWLAGVSAYRSGATTQAIEHWQKLLAVPGLDARSAEQVRQAIAQARAPTTLPSENSTKEAATTNAPTSAVSVRVSLDDTLMSRAAPDQIVFIFARAAKGPRMPLAVQRLKVSDLPRTVVLDDSMAMTPQLRLSSVDKVVFAARVSASGSATPSPGDLIGTSGELSPEKSDTVDVIINQVVE